MSSQWRPKRGDVEPVSISDRALRFRLICLSPNQQALEVCRVCLQNQRDLRTIAWAACDFQVTAVRRPVARVRVHRAVSTVKPSALRQIAAGRGARM